MDDQLFFENTSLSNITDSNQKSQLEQIKSRLLNVEGDITSQPEGTITIKNSGNIFIMGFSESIQKKISDRIHLG